ncbi:hypothetical protein CEE45_13895 [Candidatus Heimdallarchaeota archaeon B3_Heim]|nr:MAG: hypothetical protein CEE45_13895 [Candidatus Heimdallarchaeota archaeon B3_Heim]
MNIKNFHTPEVQDLITKLNASIKEPSHSIEPKSSFQNKPEEKAVFQCMDCKAIYRVPPQELLVDDAHLYLELEDMIYPPDVMGSPVLGVYVFSSIPFCAYCNGQLVLRHNRLLKHYLEYCESGHIISLAAYLDWLIDMIADNVC